MNEFSSIEAVRKGFFSRKDIETFFEKSISMEKRRIEILDMLPMDISEELNEIVTHTEKECFDCGFKAGITMMMECCNK